MRQKRDKKPESVEQTVRDIRSTYTSLPSDTPCFSPIIAERVTATMTTPRDSNPLVSMP